MPDENLIAQIEFMLSEIIRLGGENERSQMVPNLTVQNASPTGLDGFVIVSDDRDGDNIIAQKVGSVIYSNNDKVNVIFPKGGEAIAFQQGSQSTNNGIWEIVPSTSTNIYFDKGNVGIGISVSATEALEVAGNIVLDQDIIHRGDTDTFIRFTTDDVEVQVGGLSMLSLTEAAQDIITLGAGSGDIDIDFNGDGFLVGSTGNWGFGTATPGTDRVAYQGDSGANLAVGFYAGDGDGTDFVSLVMYGVGTPGSIANRERLILQYNTVGGNFRVQSEAGGTGTLRPLVFEVGSNSNQFYLGTNGGIAINASNSTLAKLLVNQSSTTAAIPVVYLDQSDLDQAFFELVGEAAAATLTQTFVDEGDVATATRIGWFKIDINDQGNQITDGSYYVPFYTLA